jgi:hypothetical protein
MSANKGKHLLKDLKTYNQSANSASSNVLRMKFTKQLSIINFSKKEIKLRLGLVVGKIQLWSYTL